ncbi:hypothetical protein GCM10027160_24720 [Streptomyces calidiresistens]
MTGRSVPVAGAETRTRRSTGRPGTGRTTGAKDRTGTGTSLASVPVGVLTTGVPFRWYPSPVGDPGPTADNAGKAGRSVPLLPDRKTEHRST